MANENKALTVEGEALDTVNNDTQLSVASVAEPMEISASVTRALADSLAKIAAYVPINYVDDMEPDINAANLNQNEQALMRVTNLMNSAVDVIKDLQSQVTKLNGDFAITKYPGGVIDISGQLTAIVSWIKSNTTIFKRYNYVRVEPTDTDGYFGTSSFDIIWNLSSVNYGWLMLRSDNSKSVLFGRLVSGEAKWDIPVFNSDLVPVDMTKTRTENPYVSETAFNRIRALKIGPNLVWVNINLAIDSSPLPRTPDLIEIGKIDGISSVNRGILINIPAQNGSGTILFAFEGAGILKIYNESYSNSVSSFVRSSFVAVVNFN